MKIHQIKSDKIQKSNKLSISNDSKNSLNIVFMQALTIF
jgi:hypothetical protein